MAEGLQAGGNIKPKRIVRLTNAADNTVVQASAATAMMYGVSGQGTRYTEITGLSLNDGFHAIVGENVKVFGAGEVAPLKAGATVVRGDRITSDSDGRGIPTTTDGHYVIGEALQSAATNEDFEVRILPSQRAS